MNANETALHTLSGKTLSTTYEDHVQMLDSKKEVFHMHLLTALFVTAVTVACMLYDASMDPAFGVLSAGVYLWGMTAKNGSAAHKLAGQVAYLKRQIDLPALSPYRA